MNFLLTWLRSVTDSPPFLGSNQNVTLQLIRSTNLLPPDFWTEDQPFMKFLRWTMCSAVSREDYRVRRCHQWCCCRYKQGARLRDPGSQHNTFEVFSPHRHWCCINEKDFWMGKYGKKSKVLLMHLLLQWLIRNLRNTQKCCSCLSGITNLNFIICWTKQWSTTELLGKMINFNAL